MINKKKMVYKLNINLISLNTKGPSSNIEELIDQNVANDKYDNKKPGLFEAIDQRFYRLGKVCYLV